ncbi:MAG: DUF2442 domain-containing protein [Desulfuromonadales bacterium]
MHTHAESEENISAEIVPTIIPNAPWRISKVSYLPGFRLSVVFNDGTKGTVDMAGFIHSHNAGVFTALRNENLFAEVTLHYGAVTWPGELDLAPDAMYEAIKRDGELRLT